MNPYTPGFAPASRSAWIKRTRRWLGRHQGVTSAQLAATLGMSLASVSNLGQPRLAPRWYCELLGALVAGWRPTQVWADPGKAFERQALLRELVLSGRIDAWTFEELFPFTTVRWRDAVWTQETDSPVPARQAVLAEAFNAGAVPCGLPFGGWTP